MATIELNDEGHIVKHLRGHGTGKPWKSAKCVKILFVLSSDGDGTHSYESDDLWIILLNVF